MEKFLIFQLDIENIKKKTKNILNTAQMIIDNSKKKKVENVQ